MMKLSTIKKFIILFTLLICVLLVFSQNTYSNEVNIDKINNKIDLVVNRAIESNRIPGIALSIV